MTTPIPDPRRWWALFLRCAAQFLVIPVGIALPGLQRALGIDPITAMNAGFSGAFIGAGVTAFVAALLAALAIRVPRL